MSVHHDIRVVARNNNGAPSSAWLSGAPLECDWEMRDLGAVADDEESESDASDMDASEGGRGGGEADAAAMERVQHAMAALRLDVATDSVSGDLAILERRLAALSLAARRERDVLLNPSEVALRRQRQGDRVGDRGARMLNGLLAALAQFDQTQFRRSKEQTEMHRVWTQACLAQIYGSEYTAQEPALLRHFGVATFWRFVAIFATRRFGKTFAMAMFGAALLWTQERSIISVFSISQRTSSAIMSKVLMFLQVLMPPGHDLDIQVKNQEQLTIVNSRSVVSTLYSYPCSPKLRGMGSDGDEIINIVLLEEAAFVKEEILNQIVIPLLKRTNSVFLTISTLGGIFDPWKRMTEAKDDRGRPVFLVLTYSTVCDDCLEAGTPGDCLHKRDMLPHWQSPEEEAKVKALMAGSPDDWMREALGVQGVTQFIPAFSRAGLSFLAARAPGVLERARDRIHYTESQRAPPLVSCVVDELVDTEYGHCFVAADPAAGGTGSNYAVVSTVFERDGTVVVVGIEDFAVNKAAPTSEMFLRHLDALRQRIPALRTATLVVAPECNMGIHATELAQQVIHHRDRTPMHQHRIIVLDEGGSQYGIRTEDKRSEITSKENMRLMAADVINAKKLRFLANTVCVCSAGGHTDAETLIARMVDQLSRFGADVLPPLRVGDRPRRRWHGKRGGAHDDLAMALQLNLLANRFFYSQPGKYGCAL